MTVLLTTPVALASSVGRGYLPGVGVIITGVFCAQVVAALGYGSYFPWSVPALFSGMAGPDQMSTGLLARGAGRTGRGRGGGGDLVVVAHR